MPITNTHAEYDARLPQWERCRDCADGSDAVKGKGTRYLPKLREQDTGDYDAYVLRALFYGATGRTIQGLVGAIFRKDPTIIVPTRFEEITEDVTYSGRAMEDFARLVEEEVLTVGRAGILVDAAEGEADRAYVSMYTGESITNWKEERVDGEMRLIRVVLLEEYIEENPRDEYAPEIKPQYRELYLDGETYIQRIWQKPEGEEDFKIIDEIIPKRRGATLDFIPFVFINAYSTEPETDKPPLLDLVDVNLSHYRSSADLEHGAHFTALPTPYAGGFDTDKDFYMGSTKAWTSTDNEITVGFLEYTGQGLKAITELLSRKEYQMAVLGARMLEEPKRAVEAADTHRIRRSGEEGALLALVGTSSEGLSQALQWLVWWSGAEEAVSENVEIELNRDFVNAQIDPSYMTALMKAQQGGLISMETFLFNMKRGEVMPPGRTIEEEQEAIDDDVERTMPSMPFGANVTPFPGQNPEDQDQEDEDDETGNQTGNQGRTPPPRGR